MMIIIILMVMERTTTTNGWGEAMDPLEFLGFILQKIKKKKILFTVFAYTSNNFLQKMSTSFVFTAALILSAAIIIPSGLHSISEVGNFLFIFLS